MIYIPNEFDKKEIEKILNNKPMLEFKKHPHDNETLWEATGITGGTAQISRGSEGFTYEEANQMADVLNADAACFKVKIEEIK